MLVFFLKVREYIKGKTVIKHFVVYKLYQAPGREA